jgi:hypothetical protein
VKDAFEVRNEDVEFTLRELGAALKDSMPEGWGFTLLMYDYENKHGGATFYLSSGNRDDVLKAMKEFIEKQERKHGEDRTTGH